MPLPLPLTVAGPAVRPRLGALFGAAGAALVRVGLDLVRPWPLALAIDAALGGRTSGWTRLDELSPTAMLVVAGVAVVVLTVASGLLDLLTATLSEQAAERIGAELRARVFDRAMRLSLRWHDQMRRGELLARLTSDVGRLLDALVAMLTLLLPDLAMLVGVLAVLFWVDVELALVGVAVVPVLAVLARRQRRHVRAAEGHARSESGRLAGTAADLFANVRAVQAFGRHEQASVAFGRQNQAVLSAALRAVRVEARWTPMADVVLAVGTGTVLVVGGRQVLAGSLSTGELVVVIAYLGYLYAPIRALCRLASTVAKATVSAERVAEILDCEQAVPERIDAVPARAPRHGIRFDRVSFTYSAAHPVLRDFDLSVAAGESICLWGPSGMGKTTVLHLLLRLYDVDAGRILLDDTDVRDLDLAGLRRLIAFVPQDPWLLDTTIAANIALGAGTDPTHAAIRRAGRLAQLDDVIATLPAGYNTPIGEGGVLLSGGQRRRIALARAVVSDAPIVLLDEPTASLDRAAAEAVIGAIRSVTAARTVITVTHDPALAATADRIVTLPPLAALELVGPFRSDVPASVGRR